jgi:hypothetical protein
VGAYFDVVVAV